MSSSSKSAERTLDILQLLSASLRPVPAMAIARRCDIPKSSTHHLLNVLRDRGWVVYFEGDRGWGLGAMAFEMGSTYLRAQPVQRLGHPVLAELRATTGLTSHLAVLRGGDVLFLDEAARRDGPSHPAAASVGVRLPAHLTAVGRAMLGWLSPLQVRALYPEPVLVRRTELGPRTVSRLLEELDAVRRHGAAVEVGLTTTGLGSVAAAVLSHEGHPTAALGVTFAADAYDEAARGELADATRAAARRLSEAMGVRRRPITSTTNAHGRTHTDEDHTQGERRLEGVGGGRRR